MLIREPEGEITHQKLGLHPLSSIATVKWVFFICLFFIEAACGSVGQP